MAEYYGASEKYDEICSWYDGYRFGSTEIFNPWSVINYFSSECRPQAFWLSTGSNEIIGEVLEQADEDIYERLNALLQGESFTTLIDTSVIYPQIRKNPSSIYSFLLVAGYLKVLKIEPSISGDFMCEVAIPNREKLHLFIIKRFWKNWTVLYLSPLPLPFRKLFTPIMQMPEDTADPGILIELKAAKNSSEDELKALSQAALQQINDRKYDAEMTARGVQKIFKFGVAFSGKKVEVVTS